MMRVLLSLAIAYCCGLLVGAAIKPEPLFFLLLSICFYASSLYLYIRYRKAYIFIYICIFLSGIFAYSSSYKALEKLSRELEGKSVTVTGVISGDITSDGNTAKYVMYVDSYRIEGVINNINCKIAVIDYNNDDKYIVPYNQIKISGVFESGNLYKNTNMVNYQESLFIKGVSGTLIADYSSKIESVPSSKRQFQKFAYDIKSRSEAIIERYVDENSYAMARGVLFGDTSDISNDQYSSFEKAGIIHIFAVSGYNIWLLYFILNHVLFFMSYHKKVRVFIILTILLLYTIISGWSASVVRAFIMAAVSLIGKILLNRDADPLTSLSISGLVILIFNPLAILDIGFELSFLSVMSIILIFPKLKKLKIKLHSTVKDTLAASTSVQIGIIPITAYYFNTVSTLSVIANVFIMPLVSLFTILSMMVLALGFALPKLAPIIGSIASGIGGAIFKLSETISSVSWSSFNMVSPSILEISLYYGLLILICSEGTVKSRIAFFARFIMEKYRMIIPWIAVCIVAVGLIYKNSEGMLKISFIDVGQGDSILISTPDKKHILVDGGGKAKTPYSSFDIGEEILKPYLLKHGISKLDMVISTHSHDDHLLGLVPVIKSFEVGKFIKPEVLDIKNYKSITDIGLVCQEDIVNVKEGDIIKAGDVLLYVLNPGTENLDENNSSLVIKLVYKDFSALLTGDIEARNNKLLSVFSLKSNILKIPHHGSSDSINEEFLKEVSPDAAVICVGKNNFGHPSEYVVNMVEKSGVKLYRTDIDGEVIITTRGKGFSVKTAVQRLIH